MDHAEKQNVTLRLAMEEDLQPLLRLGSRAFPRSLRWVAPSLARPYWRSAFTNAGSELWVLESQGVMLLLIVDELEWARDRPLRRPTMMALAQALPYVCALSLPLLKRVIGRMRPQRVSRTTMLAPVRMIDHKDRVFVDTTLVDPTWQRRGFGARLSILEEDRARIHGRRYVRLLVREGNGPMRALQERLGYELVGIHSGRCVYVKDLDRGSDE